MFEINEEPPRSDCHVQNHAADARERHHSPRMAQYGRLGRNHRGAWTPMHLPRGAVRPNGQRAAPRRPHRIRRLAGIPRPCTQTDHSGRTQKIHPLMRLVPGAKTMHQGTHPDSRKHRLPDRDPLASAAQTVWIPRANHQRPGRGDGQCRARSRNFGRPAADPIRPRCRSAPPGRLPSERGSRTSHARTITLRRSPMPSTCTMVSSPGSRWPEAFGVPVMMTSPGSRVENEEIAAICSGML